MHSKATKHTSVSISTARKILGGIASQTIYRLINSGELRSYCIGRRRFVSLEAISDYIKLAERASEPKLKSANQK